MRIRVVVGRQGAVGDQVIQVWPRGIAHHACIAQVFFDNHDDVFALRRLRLHGYGCVA